MSNVNGIIIVQRLMDVDQYNTANCIKNRLQTSNSLVLTSLITLVNEPINTDIVHFHKCSRTIGHTVQPAALMTGY